MIQINIPKKQKQNHRHREHTGCCQGEDMGMEWEAGHSRCKLSDMERIDNEVLLYSTGNYIQYPEINHNGKEAFKQESIYMCNGITLLHSRNQQNLGNQ